MHDLFISNAFTEVTSYWQRIKVPRFGGVEIPTVFTYRLRELRDLKSGWWFVAYTEFAAKDAAFLPDELYDSCRLWCLSGERIRNICFLDLV